MRNVLVVGALLLFAGCHEDPTPDGGTDAGHDVAVPDTGGADLDASTDLDASDQGEGTILGSRLPVPIQTGVSPDGASDITTALDAEARAGRITTEDTGFYGLWSHCKQGDFKLYNERVEACISNEISARYETFAGGGLVDMRVVGQTGPDVFDLYNGKIAFNVAHPETVQVIRDGSDGGPAVIRAAGTDMPAAYFVGVAGDQLFSRMNLDVTVEYRLAPGEDFIEILTYVTNPTDVPAMVQKGDLIAWGDRADVFRQDVGFGDSGDAFSWMAAAGQGYAFAYVTPDDALRSLSASFGSPPWEITQGDAFLLQPGESYAHFGRMIIGDALDPVIRRAHELLGETPPKQRIAIVTDTGGAPAVGRRVEVFDADDASIAGGTTDETGRVFLSVPDGPHRFEISGVTGGGGFSDLVTIGAADNEVPIEVPQTATIELAVTADGTPSPAAIVITGALGNYQGATWADRDQIELMPGDWTVTVSHGPEYDWTSQDVTVAAGETATVNAALTRLMDTTDWIAGDFHQHMEPSSDSRVWVEDRVLDNAAQGVELLVPTDHDVVTDLVPIIAAAGLQSQMTTIPGAELSPKLGHLNVYPMKQVLTAPGRGTVPLSELRDGQPHRNTVPELIAIARSLPSDPVVQLNHPRGSAGLFDLVDYDPEVDPGANTHAWFPHDFDAMEIPNGHSCEQFRDWSGLWNAGMEPTGIGSSDSHYLWAEVGTQRTYLYAPGIEVSELNGDEVRDIVKSGRVVISTSVFLEFTDGKIPGTTVDGSAGTVDFGLRVQSANWAGVDAIRVIVNGVQTDLVDVTPIDGTLDFDGTISVPITEDSWVVFLASGDATGAYRPTGTAPYGFNNPVRVDFDGNGYTAPGVRPLSLDDIPLCN